MRSAGLVRILDAVFGNDVFRHSTKSNTVFLTYHGLVRDDDSMSAWTFVRERAFAEQMEYLAERFEVISLRDALDNVPRKTAKKRAVITFDDGYASNYEIAFPILKRLQLPSTIFVTTRFIETATAFWYDKVVAAAQLSNTAEIDLTDWGLPRMEILRSEDAELRWAGIQLVLSKLKELSGERREELADELLRRYGIEGPKLEAFRPLTIDMLRTLQQSAIVEIGSHTHSHEILPQLKTPDVVATLAKSTQLLTEWLGTRPSSFAYPNGDFDNRVRQCVQDAGYECAVTTQYDEWKGEGDRLAIPRVAIGAFDNTESFALKISGFNSVAARLTRFVRRQMP
jgi:peptidoglycan/xylan/chitin deacetylase (PgdA/CDA1 family)